MLRVYVMLPARAHPHRRHLVAADLVVVAVVVPLGIHTSGALLALLVSGVVGLQLLAQASLEHLAEGTGEGDRRDRGGG